MKPSLLSCLIAATAFAGVGSTLAEPLQVAASVPAQGGFVEKIGGAHVELILLVEEGQDPHSFNPSPKKVVRLSESAVLFTSGMPFEEPLVEKLKATKGGPKIVSLAEGIKLYPYEEAHDHDHDHEHEHAEKPAAGGAAKKKEEHDHDHDHDHHHEGMDPHIWLSPVLIETQAKTIAKTLSELDPAHAADYAANLKAFTAEIQAVHKDLIARLAPMKGSTFYVFHDAFSYFGRSYGLKQRAFEVAGREPSAKQLVHMIEEAREDKVKMILVQPQYGQRAAKKIADEVGATLITVDPESKDVLGNLKRLAEAIQSSTTPAKTQ